MGWKTEIEQYFTAHREQIVEDVCRLVRIKSVRTEAEGAYPFGKGPYRALCEAMELAKEAGFSVQNHENYVCTADMTALQPGLDILAHLDVVPCENNWTVCDPYEPVVKDGNLYGRGAIDDKGPAVAALYAMRCIKELGIPLNQNVRLILGTDEECGSSDVHYYYQKVPEAPMTFTPDASFPLINVEKGRFVGNVCGRYQRDEAQPCIISASVGIKENVVPETACAMVAGFTCEELTSYLQAAEQQTGAKFRTESDNGAVKVICKGVGGHAAYPEAANNALTALLQLLSSLPCADTEGFRQLKALQRLLPHGDYYGKAMGVAMEDEVSGKLTLSLNMLELDETGFRALFDSRCPACATEENVKTAAENTVHAAGLKLESADMTLPHCVDGNSDFVKTLLKAYEDWTGIKGEPQYTGGGTYVHDLKNGVAFGCEVEGIDTHLHGADEFIPVEQLLLSGKIFAQAIIDLCT